MKIISIMLSVIFSFFVCSSSIRSQEWGKVTDEEWKQGAPADYPEANVIILFDKGKLEVTRDASHIAIRFHRHVRMKILNKAGVSEAGDISFAYWKDDNIKDVDAQTICQGKKSMKVDRRGIFTKSAENLMLKSIAFPAVDSGCILEYRYTNVNERLFYLDPWYFQSNYYTLASEFTLMLDKPFVYQPTLFQVSSQDAKPTIEDYHLDGKISYTWKLNNLPPVKDEPYMSCTKSYMATIYNQLVAYNSPDYLENFAKSWGEMGKSYDERLKEFSNADDQIKKVTDSLVSAITEANEKIRIIYNFVEKEIELDNTLGLQREWKLKDIIANKRSDEYDKNILLTEMIKAAGIPAWPVRICTRSNGVFVPMFRSSRQFDHIICAAQLDKSMMFLDASVKYCPYGSLPPNSRAIEGLLIDGDSSRVIDIALVNPKSRRTDMTYIYVRSDGSASCQTSVKFGGYFATEYAADIDKHTPEDFAKEYILNNLNLTFKLDSASFDKADPEAPIANIYYTIDDLGKKLDNNIVIKPPQFYFEENPFKNEKRFFPVDFNYPFVFYNMLRITFEDSLTSCTLPESKKIDFPGASYTRNSVYDNLAVVVNCQLSIDRPVILPIGYSELRDFFGKIASTTEDQIIATTAVKSGE